MITKIAPPGRQSSQQIKKWVPTNSLINGLDTNNENHEFEDNVGNGIYDENDKNCQEVLLNEIECNPEDEKNKLSAEPPQELYDGKNVNNISISTNDSSHIDISSLSTTANQQNSNDVSYQCAEEGKKEIVNNSNSNNSNILQKNIDVHLTKDSMNKNLHHTSTISSYSSSSINDPLIGLKIPSRSKPFIKENHVNQNQIQSIRNKSNNSYNESIYNKNYSSSRNEEEDIVWKAKEDDLHRRRKGLIFI
jgi:hypothetical protein